VNVSGTCYIGDDYFTDVIHRFPLRDSIDDKFVKSIRYVAEDSSGSEDEKFQKIYDNHIENKTVKYRKVKPITILVTKNIAACKRLTDKLVTFLAKKEGISKEKAAEKVLVVTSANEHKSNIPILRRVDDKDNPIEWITSVSMLSEGWDVKNVFQIVPHEERAFNSKLLIAQVLGRGLRIPEVYRGNQPVVTVFNHDGSVPKVVEKGIGMSYPIGKPNKNEGGHTDEERIPQGTGVDHVRAGVIAGRACRPTAGAIRPGGGQAAVNRSPGGRGDRRPQAPAL